MARGFENPLDWACLDNVALLHDEHAVAERRTAAIDGSTETLRQNENVKAFYLGLGATGRRNYRDVKHYRRRKRWLA